MKSNGTTITAKNNPTVPHHCVATFDPWLISLRNLKEALHREKAAKYLIVTQRFSRFYARGAPCL